MNNISLINLTVWVPLFGAFLLPVVGKISESLRNMVALLLVLVSAICATLMIPSVMAGNVANVELAGIYLFRADMLAVFMAIVSSSIGAIIVFYSFGYINHYEHRNEYYFMVVLFLAAMMGLVFATNLIAIYIFWEITAIACWRLIGFFREKPYILRADKAFLVTVFGALVMLIGFLMIYSETGSFDLMTIKADTILKPVSNLALFLILFGILSKSATLPLHTWLPDAGVAPSPVTALLHAAVLVKIGVYVFARLFVATFTIDIAWHTIVPVIAGVSALVSAGAAMIDTDLKRIIAYSTISQIGFIFLGLAIGNDIALAGGLLYILMHGISKAGLFLCAGIIEQGTHTKDITKMGGLKTQMPITAVAFAICAFSVMGIPPLGGFFSKYMVLAGAFTSGHIYIAATFFAGAAMTIIYLFRVFSMVFLGEPKQQFSYVKEGSLTMLISVSLLAVLSIAGGVLIKYPMDFVRLTVMQILGIAQ